MVKSIDNFTYGKRDGRPDLDLGHQRNEYYKEYMREAVRWATMRNSKRLPVMITFYGSWDADLQWTVECEDAETQQRIEEVLAHLRSTRQTI
ncbi:hypothetical protein WBJ53_08710 [Spirosoma sp. SC4-14]|uniref:hypothetical protein n=1 Tax=Spirosoma sp. SC4-14 TaxID=3128900 RepID=UPI0030CBAA0B